MSVEIDLLARYRAARRRLRSGAAPAQRPEPAPAAVEPPPEGAPVLAHAPTIHAILEAVAREYGVTVPEIVSSRRCKAIMPARQLVMYLARTFTPRSLPEIARRLGGRDHTTILWGARRTADRLGKPVPVTGDMRLDAVVKAHRKALDRACRRDR
jgi:hypothetical protein